MKAKTSALVAALAVAALNGAWASSARAQHLDTATMAEPQTLNIDSFLEWVVASGDNNGVPFAIVDKGAALVSVYDPSGQLLGAEAALVGSAMGDDSAPHVGDRELAAIRPEERTTPAGRFVAAYGPARGHGSVLWVDYATAISLHAVVTANKKERRIERLQSSTPEDNRITYGCINVSAAFYDDVVRPTFKSTRGVVYVLPDSKTIDAVFPSLAIYRRTHLASVGVPDRERTP